VADDLRWLIKPERRGAQRVAVAYWQEQNGAVVALPFAMTGAGAIDIVGLHVEHASHGDERQVARIAEYVGTTFANSSHTACITLDLSHPNVALARQSTKDPSTAAGAIFSQRPLGALPTPRQCRLAELVIEYDQLIATGVLGPRSELARRRGVSTASVRNDVTAAIRLGLWDVSAGRPGVLTDLARVIGCHAEQVTS